MKRSGSFILGALLLPAFAAAQPAPAAPPAPGVSQAAPAVPEVKSGGGDKACLKAPPACKDQSARKKEQRRKQKKGKRESKKAGAVSSINKDAPDWILKGGGAFKDSGTLAFYGVGSAPPAIGDEYLRSETADNRARADIQNGFRTSTESTGTITRTADGGEKVERAVTTFKSGKIPMARIIDHYQAADGTVYSLAKVDIDQQGQGQAAGKP